MSKKVNSLCIGDESVMASVSAKNIGVVTESTLNMSLQESNTSRSCYASVWDIGQIRQYLSQECTKIPYTNSFLFGCPGDLTRMLQLKDINPNLNLMEHYLTEDLKVNFTVNDGKLNVIK